MNLSAEIKSVYDLKFSSISGEELKLSDYKNKVIVVINVASQCGFTKQYEDIQLIWEKYKNKGLIILGVPSDSFGQELDTNEDVKNFCESKFGITFPMTEKVDVLGKKAHPFYLWAHDTFGKSSVPKWNFHKIIVGKDGKVNATFSSFTKPTSNKFIEKIENLL